jgi:tRNA U38,U39,U40 pseudouridine synthase TruA
MFSIDVKDASKTFDAKARTTNRTYYYYLPAFCLNNSFSSLIPAALKLEIDEIFEREGLFND